MLDLTYQHRINHSTPIRVTHTYTEAASEPGIVLFFIFCWFWLVIIFFSPARLGTIRLASGLVKRRPKTGEKRSSFQPQLFWLAKSKQSKEVRANPTTASLLLSIAAWHLNKRLNSHEIPSPDSSGDVRLARSGKS